MPWSESNRMEERARFVLDALRGHFTMTELCYRYGVYNDSIRLTVRPLAVGRA